ncbi:hypothetical protein [Pseudoxanthomonas sp. z9]|uniref:hypothetical protein n=1 Tax=Pseudoxanthomonas sp. z9 TaxID=2584942 RepID=UPI0011429424|nr:hypothetical protein [Pseudoxanthomonas sp. z9]
MAEKYDVAAKRHLETATTLLDETKLDDAGYHYGISGETAIKFALTQAGLSRQLVALNRNNPLRAHLPSIKQLIKSAEILISTHARGRMSSPIAAVLLDASLQTRFAGWDINIRYADERHCPLREEQVLEWRNDAEYLVQNLVF